jgi:hypothetical protein
MSDVIELKNRQLVELPQIPVQYASIRHIAVALDNDEAQKFIDLDYRVFGDDQGPYLVVRIPDTYPAIIVMNLNDVDVKIRPKRWFMKDESGVICWLVNAI